jgi:hypothetical protein
MLRRICPIDQYAVPCQVETLKSASDAEAARTIAQLDELRAEVSSVLLNI